MLDLDPAHSDGVRPRPSRRALLRNAAGAVGLAAMSGGLLTACGSDAQPADDAAAGPATVGGTVTFGSNHSDPYIGSGGADAAA